MVMGKETSGFALLVLLAALVAVAIWWHGALEDPFMLHRYAQHLAAGDGLARTAGEGPVEGLRQLGTDTKFDTDHLPARRPHYVQTNIPRDEVLAGRVQRPWRLADRELWASEEFQRDYVLLEGMDDSCASFLRRDLQD